MADEFKCFSLSDIGWRHIVNGICCQDYSAFEKNDNYIAICVSDGHGGQRYVRSQYGSKSCCEVFLSCVKDFYDLISNELVTFPTAKRNKTFFRKKQKFSNPNFNLINEKNICQFIKYFVYKWNEKVREDVLSNPFDENEINKIGKTNFDCNVAYGSTFIGVIMFGGCFVCIQIGDGECLLLDGKNNLLKPIREDEKCVGNITTSMCDSNAVEEFRFTILENIPKAIFIATDGVEKSFNPEDNKPKYNFYKKIYQQFNKKKFEDFINDLKDFTSTLSKLGSGDDISISAIIRK